MQKKHKIEDTNALNKFVPKYKPPVKEPKGSGDRASGPNYKKLSQTPRRAAQEQIAANVQYGQPAFTSKKTPKGQVPKQASNQLPFKRVEQPATPVSVPKKPLQIAKKPKPRVQAETKSIGTPIPSKFRNLFDNPLTPRELQQLRLAQLKGKDQQQTQALLNQLLGQSRNLAGLLAQTTQPQVKSSPPSPKKLTRAEEIQKELDEANVDKKFGEEEYDKLEAEEQKKQIKRLRHKYYAGTKSNMTHILKVINDKIANLNDQLQEL